MDILAPVFAYLTCVAGILGGFVVAFYVVVSPPNHAVLEPRNEPVASVTATKSAPLIDLKKPVLHSAAADSPAVNHAAPNTQKREEARQPATARTANPQGSDRVASSTTATQNRAANELRGKTKITRAQWREMVQQERKRRLAFQQNADFESRFLGYAD
jgi:hypothetical protein